MAARGRSASALFRAMYSVLDDAAALVTRYGSLPAAAERLDALERKNAELQAGLDASLQHIDDLKARDLLSPSKVVAILQQECTCVGDMSLLGTMLSESLRSGKAASVKGAARVILSVHQVEPGEVDATDTSAPSTSTDTVDSVVECELTSMTTAAVKPIKAASEESRQPLKRKRREKGTTLKSVTPTEVATPQWTDRIQDRLRAWRSVVGNNGATTPADALRSMVASPDAVDSATGATRVAAITRRDQIDTSPESWAQLGVEVAISRLGEKALSWSPPENLMCEIEKRQRNSPALTVEAFTALDAARPWDFAYLRRCDVSYTFDYHALKSRAKVFVRAVRWFQFEFRRELWEWMHWIPMAKKNRSPEWERYRRSRNDRSAQALAAWDALCMDAIKLVRDELIPVDFFLDPSVWVMRYYQWLSWKPSTTDLVAEQAAEDERHPARSFYVRDLDDHPFFDSPFSHLYSTAHALPRLADVDGKREVHIDHSDAGTRPCPTSWGTTELAPVFRVVLVGGRASRVGSDVKSSAGAFG